MVKRVLDGRRGVYSFLSQECISLSVFHIEVPFE